MTEIGKRMTFKQEAARTARRKRPGARSNPCTLVENPTEAVREISSHGHRFQLRTPIDLKVRQTGSYCFVGYPALEIEGYGKDESEALKDFGEAFGATWEAYADEDPDRLTRDAQELGKKLRDLVAHVEPV